MPLAHTSYYYTLLPDNTFPVVSWHKEWSRWLTGHRDHSLGEGGSHSRFLRATLRVHNNPNAMPTVCFAAARPPCRTASCRLFESLYSIILQLLFNYLEGVAHVPRGRGRFVATCRLLDRSTTPAFTYQYTLNRTRNTGSDTVKSQQFQCFTPYGHKATKPNRQSGITVENEQPLSRSERFRGCIRISPSGDQVERIRHSSIQWPLIRLRRHRPWSRIPSRRCRNRGESDACRHAPATNWKAPSRRCCATR